MKNRVKLFGFIALAAIIIISMTGCPDGRNNNGGNPDPDPTGTPVKTLTGITAEYVPTTEIFADTARDTLKEGLTVKAAYSDNTGKTLSDSDYTLSGTLAVGESAITVSYTEGGVTKTAAFTVTVDALTHAHNWSLKSTTATCTTAGEELWECDAITPAHHEDRHAAALGHIWEWVVDSPSAGIDTQVCSRCSQEGETRYVFTTAASMTTFLNSQTDPDTVYNIKLNVATLPWSSSGQAQTAFNGKFVNLDLSGSTFTSVNANAFRNCTLLTGITIPEGVTSIADGANTYSGAFNGCTNLTSVTFAEGSQLTTIGNYAFYNCAGLTDITIPEGVTSIGNYAFTDCTSLTSINIPEGVTSILLAFSGCTSLTSITIPASVTTIGNGSASATSGAFYRCTGLTSVTFAEGSQITTIADRAFNGCTGLTDITIPDSVTSIGTGAFNGCTGLTSITIPDSVTSIGQQAFQGCTGLTSITIPASVTTLSSAFQYCSGLTSINIPTSVTSIATFTFRDCTSLADITIPASVTSIGQSAFQGCTGLVSVTFEGTIASDSFNTLSTFPGNLRAVYLAEGGGPGTYIVTSASGVTKVWTKQP